MKMKLFLKLGLTLILIAILVAGVFIYLNTRGRLSEKRINQLRYGMSESEILSLLGNPYYVGGREHGKIDGLQTTMIITYNYELDDDTKLIIFYSGNLMSVLIDEKDQNPIWIMDSRDPEGTTPLIDIESRTFGRTQPRFEISDANTQVSTETLNQIERGMSQADLESILGKANSITEDGEYIYRFSENYDITIEFISDGISSVELTDRQGHYIHSLLENYDPPRTRIYYDPVAASFSKEYGPVYFEQTIASFQIDALNQIQSGMSREDVIDIFGLPDEELGNGAYYQISENQRFCFIFYNSLCIVSLQENAADSTPFNRRLLDDRDPIGTRIQYDPQTGYFSKIYSEVT